MGRSNALAHRKSRVCAHTRVQAWVRFQERPPCMSSRPRCRQQRTWKHAGSPHSCAALVCVIRGAPRPRPADRGVWHEERSNGSSSAPSCPDLGEEQSCDSPELRCDGSDISEREMSRRSRNALPGRVRHNVFWKINNAPGSRPGAIHTKLFLFRPDGDTS